MKFVCDSCHTKYSIGDERVHGRVLKIRCKTCDHIITVREPVEARAPTPAPSFGDSFGDSDHTMVSAQPPSPAPAAPPPSTEEWYVSFDGEQEGPMSLERAIERVRAERPKGKEAHAWKGGFFVWLPVEEVPEFARALEKPKPAPPPPVRATKAQPVKSPSGSQPIAAVSQSVIAKPAPKLDLPKLTDAHPIVVGSASVDSGPVPLLPPPPEAMVPTPLSIPLPMIPAPLPPPTEGAIPSPMEVQLTKPEPRVTRKQLEELEKDKPKDPTPKPALVEPPKQEVPAAMAAAQPTEKASPLDTGPVPLPPPPGDDFLIGEPSATVNLANLSGPTALPRDPQRSVETFGGVTVAPPSNGASTPAPVVVVTGPASAGAAPWVKWSVAVLVVLVVALSGMLLYMVMKPSAGPTPVAQPTVPNEKVGDEPIALPDPAPPTTIGPVVDKKAPPPPPTAPTGTTAKKPSSGKSGKGDGLTADQRKLAALYAEGGEGESPKEVQAVDRGSRAGAQVSQQAILDVVKQNQRALSLCYQRVLKHDTTLKHARLVTHVKIGVSGMVKDVSIPDSELGSAEIGQCITATIKRWRFPSADNEYETEFPIILQAD